MQAMTISDERRLVTVLFVDLVGFTGRAELSDPEELREVQRAYFASVAAEVERYGGSVEKYIGDAVMAIYGAPRAHDDDAERALKAAIGIRDAVARGADGLEVRIGVNTGEVVGGAGSGPQSHEYTVTGDAVNVAARLQQAAEPAEIIVGATTRRLAADGFDFAPMAPLDLKGKQEPVEAWRLVRALPQRPRVRGSESPLVGRRRELTLLEGALETAGENRGLLVGLSGEAGIGKSRLALELRQRAEAQGFGSSWTSALSYASSFPFHVVEQLAGQLLHRGPDVPVREALAGQLPDTDPDTLDQWAAAVADVAGEADDDQRRLLADVTPPARQRLLVQALGAILVAQAAQRPQLIVLDDLHWADASSLSVLDELMAVVPDRPIIVLALYRPGWSNPWASRSFYQQLNLDRLRESEVRELVSALSGGTEIEPARTAQLLHRSGGNPFFLEELLRGGASSGAGAGGLPETLHEVLLARIDALPADARAVLQVAAVIGMEFSERALAAVEPTEGTATALAALQRDDLIVARDGGSVDDAAYAMRHPLVHEVAYRSLLVARRRVLHRRIGEWLEASSGEEALAQMAAHFRDGDDLERAREYLPRAAERAARLNAPREARDWYLEAADLFDSEPARRAQMLERAAHFSYLIGEVARAIELVTEAGRLYDEVGDRLHALDSRRLLGRYYWMNGRGRRGETEVLAAIEGLEQLPPSPELALAYSYRSQMRMLMPDYPTGERVARQAIEVAEEVGSVEAMTHALNNLGTSLLGLGDPSGLDHLRRSLKLALDHNLPDDAGRAYTNVIGQGAAISYFEPDEHEALFAEMLAYDQRVAPGGVFEQWHRGAQSEMWIFHGRWDEAERELAELGAISGANRYLQVDVGAYAALLAAYRGRYEDAIGLVRPVMEAAIEIDDLQAYAPTLLASAHAERGLGRGASAIEMIERGIQRRADTPEANISTWYLFEAVDVVSWLARDPDVDAALVARGLEALGRLAAALEVDVVRGGTDPELRVRRALHGAAVEQLRVLESGPGRETDAADGFSDRMLAHAAGLREARRVFDAARVELWTAEATEDAGLAAAARAIFEELRAAPYADRARTAAG
jgi:class 3 adenylate cyclase/tetratricopeptide (TPR) repeat protein